MISPDFSKQYHIFEENGDTGRCNSYATLLQAHTALVRALTEGKKVFPKVFKSIAISVIERPAL